MHVFKEDQRKSLKKYETDGRGQGGVIKHSAREVKKSMEDRDVLVGAGTGIGH